MSDQRAGGGFALLFISLGVIWGYTFLSARLGIGFAIPVGVVGALSTAIALRGPLGLAVARRLGLKETPPDEVTGQVLGELDEIRGRLEELAERVDFSERLLAAIPKDAGREASRL